MNSLFFGNFVA